MTNRTPEELIEDFEFLDDWEERYRYIIDLGKKLLEFPDEEKNDSNKVSGCISQVWIISEYDEPILRFKGDSDAFIVKGLVAILMELYDGKTPQEILSIDAKDVFNRLGLDDHISSNRGDGFNAMIERINRIAIAHKG